MKIIKKDCVQTWFSPKRYMEERITPADNHKQWFMILSNACWNRKIHRKHGPAQVHYSKNNFLNSIIWSNKGNYLRKDGPIIIWVNKKNLRWCITGQEKSGEEPYWNK